MPAILGPYPDVAAVLLAGGSSRRMGADKALLPIRGQPVLQHAAAQLRILTDQVLLSADDRRPYDFLGLPAVPDVFPGCGPMAGLHAAMLRTSRPWLIVLACDLPDATAPLLRRLVDAADGFDAVIPAGSDRCLHPVCAVYNRTCLPAIERLLKSGKHRLLSLLEEPGLRIRILSSAEGGFADADLVDLDSPIDYSEYLKRSQT